jgi:hypothetical protein
MEPLDQHQQPEFGLTTVSTAHLADACLVVGVDVRCGPTTLRPVTAHTRFAARHNLFATPAASM